MIVNAGGCDVESDTDSAITYDGEEGRFCEPPLHLT